LSKVCYFLPQILWFQYDLFLFICLLGFVRHLFLTEEDITSLSCFQVCKSWELLWNLFAIISQIWWCLLLMILLLQNRTLFAIKTPEASYLEVPDPDEVLSVDTWNFKNCWNVFLPDVMLICTSRILVPHYTKWQLEAPMDPLMCISWGNMHHWHAVCT
jgi:hypothetical protein